MEIMNREDLSKLCKAAVTQKPLTFSANESYSADEVNDVLREQFRMLGSDYKSFRRNQNLIYELIEQTIAEVLPRKVMPQYERFADVQPIAQGDQAPFRLRITEAARKRAKAFVTRVGLAGRYETFMLDGTDLTVQTSAIGGAVKIGFEEFLDGRYTLADFTEVMLEGMDEYIYNEILKALDAVVAQTPANNRVTTAGFDEASMDQLLAVADSYGTGRSTIFCTQEFASKIPSSCSSSQWSTRRTPRRLSTPQRLTSSPPWLVTRSLLRLCSRARLPSAPSMTTTTGRPICRRTRSSASPSSPTPPSALIRTLT